MTRTAPIRPRRALNDEHDEALSEAQLVNDLATELNLLTYSWTDPEAFLERRNNLVIRLRRLSKRLGAPKERKAEPTTSWRPPAQETPKPRRVVREVLVRRW